MRSWNWEKLKIVDNGFIEETGFFNINIKETCKCFFFIFISVILWLVFFGVCIYIQYFFDVVRNKLPELIKRRFVQKKYVL